MSEFEQSLYAILVSLPTGKLSTYGRIASRCGYPNYARQVGKALSKLPSDTKLPWHRIVNSQGKIPLSEGRFLKQKQRLNAEGISITEQGKVVNFKHYLW